MNSDKNLESAYVRSYYDTFLSKYDKEYAYYRWAAGPVERLHFIQTRRTLLPYFNKITGSVLEIGGGDAVWTREYIDHVQKLTFLDISKEMITRAQKRLVYFSQKITYVNSDFLQNDFPSNSFDHIVSIRNLEYFIDKKHFISEVKRLLKDSGTFLLVTKSPQYSFHDNSQGKLLHTAQIYIKELLKLIKSQGLKVIAVRPAIFGKLFRFSLVRFIFSIFHRILLSLPWKIAPLRFLSYLSESFMIYVQK